MRIDRMLAITVMLLNRERIPAKELADKFEVSVRTIYRDIDAINMAGIPVISYQGNNGGFGIMENYKLDRQVLSLTDMTAMISALKSINTTLEYQGLDSAIEKITNLAPSSINGVPIDEQFVIDIIPWGYRKKQRNILQGIHSSISQCRKIEFLYRKYNGETNVRIIEPMTLLYKGFAWYLFAWCTLRQEFRVFRLSRMNEIVFLEEKFDRKDGFYKDYISLDDVSGEETEIVLRFNPASRSRVEDYFESQLISYEKDGYMIVKISFPIDEWVYSTILSFTDQVEVLKPVEVREELKRKVHSISKLYDE